MEVENEQAVVSGLNFFFIHNFCSEPNLINGDF